MLLLSSLQTSKQPRKRHRTRIRRRRVCWINCIIILLFLQSFITNEYNNGCSFLFIDASSSASSSTETIIGIVGNDFVILASDNTISSAGGIAFTKSSNVNKIHLLTNPYPNQNTITRYYINNNEKDPEVVLEEETERQEPQSEHEIIVSKEDTDDHDDDIFMKHAIISEQKLHLQKQIIQKQKQQPTVAIAGIGNHADYERFVQYLKSHITIYEYEHSNIGCDIQYIHFPTILRHRKDTDNNYNDFDGNSRNHRMMMQSTSSSCILPIHSIAHYTRTYISNQLRSRSSCNVCLLIGGMSMLSSSLSTKIMTDTTDTTTTSNDKASSSIILYKPCLYWLDEYGSIQLMKQYGCHGLGSLFILSLLDQYYVSSLNKHDAIQLIISCYKQLQKRYIINTHSYPIIQYIDQYGSEIIHIVEK